MGGEGGVCVQCFSSPLASPHPPARLVRYRVYTTHEFYICFNGLEQTSLSSPTLLITNVLLSVANTHTHTLNTHTGGDESTVAVRRFDGGRGGDAHVRFGPPGHFTREHMCRALCRAFAARRCGGGEGEVGGRERKERKRTSGGPANCVSARRRLGGGERREGKGGAGRTNHVEAFRLRHVTVSQLKLLDLTDMKYVNTLGTKLSGEESSNCFFTRRTLACV